jgi:integrase
LGAVFDEAIRRRLAHVNPVRSLRTRRKTRRAEIREVEETIIIPEREQVRAMLATAGGTNVIWLYARKGGQLVAAQRAPTARPRKALKAFQDEYPDADVAMFRPAPWLRPFLSTLALAGLRIGEARGLNWLRVTGDALQVREGVDRFNVLDAVKTVAGLRDVPIGPQLAGILAAWKMASKSEAGLVFPSVNKSPLTYSNIVNRQIGPLQLVLGITASDGSPQFTPHSFRHFAVSLWIDEGANIKQVSEWAGHESPEFTQRVYGHLIKKDRTDRRAATAGEASVLGALTATTRAQHANDNPPETSGISIS